jgi:hypothetical protein
MITSFVIYSVYRYFKGNKDEDGGAEGEKNQLREKSAAKQGAKMALDWYTIGLCTVYMFAGPVLILLNKFILSNLNFPYPMFLSALGVFFSAAVARVLVMAGVVKLQRKEQVEGMHYIKRVLPVGLFHAGTLAFVRFLSSLSSFFLHSFFISFFGCFYHSCRRCRCVCRRSLLTNKPLLTPYTPSEPLPLPLALFLLPSLSHSSLPCFLCPVYLDTQSIN